MLAWLKKMRPKWSASGNTSSWLGRCAPPESTRYTHGSRFSSATRCARRCFLMRDGVVRAALHRRVVAHHHAFAAGDAADAGDDAGAGRFVAVHAEGRERRQLEERRARVQQHFHPVAGQQFAARHVFGARRLAAARARFSPGARAIRRPARAWPPRWRRIQRFSYRLWIRAAA